MDREAAKKVAAEAAALVGGEIVLCPSHYVVARITLGEHSYELEDGYLGIKLHSAKDARRNYHATAETLAAALKRWRAKDDKEAAERKRAAAESRELDAKAAEVLATMDAGELAEALESYDGGVTWYGTHLPNGVRLNRTPAALTAAIVKLLREVK